MRHIQFGEFDPARLLTYVLSRLVEAQAVENAASNRGTEKTDPARTQLPRSSSSAAGEILKFAERKWPSRYY